MQQYIPGNPRIVFTNQPNKPLEYVSVATQAPKDGTYVSWTTTPQLEFGFNESTQFIKRSTFQAIGSTIDPARGWHLYDPVGNLGPSAANSCLWDYAGQSSVGGGYHGKFLLAGEVHDVREGNPTLLGNIYIAEQLDMPFDYFAFETVDTNAVRTMWGQGIINSVVRSSLWHRLPIENPDWLPTGFIRVMAGMGPGQLKPNSWGRTPLRRHPGSHGRRAEFRLQLNDGADELRIQANAPRQSIRRNAPSAHPRTPMPRAPPAPRSLSVNLCAAHHAKQHAAISGPSGRVSDASARLNDATSNPRRLPRCAVSATTAKTTKNVNCRVASPPPEVHSANVALVHSSPSAIHQTSARLRTPGSRHAHHAIAPSVAIVNAADNHQTASSGGTPVAAQIAANSKTHRKLE